MILRACAFSLVFTFGVLAQQTPEPEGAPLERFPRLQTAPPAIPIGKGVISGTVINSKTHEPVKKAHVTLSAQNQLSAITDASGAFTFRALPAGQFSLGTYREDYYPSPLAQLASNVITLGEGEETTGIELKLTPTAAISGRVLDEDDTPVPNCFVSTLRWDNSQGSSKLLSQGGANTNGLGQFRIHGLAPGKYVLKAWCQENFPAPHGFMRRDDPAIPKEGFPAVIYGDPASDVPTSGLRVAPGSDLTEIDFHVKRAPLFRLHGSVSGADPAVLQNVNVLLSSPDPRIVDTATVAGSWDAAHREFNFPGVAAGSYDLAAFIVSSEGVWEAREPVEIGKTQSVEHNLKLVAGTSVSGVIEADNPNFKLEGLPLSLFPLSPNYHGGANMSPVAADGTFEVKSVLPGRFHLALPNPTAYIKSLTIAGREVSVSDFELNGSGSAPMHVTLGTKTGRVTVDASPQPRSGQILSAVLIPANFSGMPVAIPSSNPDREGKLTFPNVAPGKYRALVLQTSNVWVIFSQPQLLKSLEDRTTPVEVTEGGDAKATAPVVSPEDLEKAADEAEQ